MTALLLLAVIAGWTATSLAAQRLLRSERRDHKNERQLLLNQILHLTGKPWQQAPANSEPPADEEPPHRYTATPEQYPAH